jgi:riboflavin-specific deaminase-like protein
MFGGREKPFVFINGAVSADGKLALENRSVIQFSSPRDQFFVFQLRARADAVLCGMETVEIFSIDLGVGPSECRVARKRRKLAAEPLRVLVSMDGDIDFNSRVFREGASPMIILTQAGARRCSANSKRSVQIKAFGRKTIDLVSAFRWLRDELGINRILCEGGGETNAALIQAGVVDQIHLTVCPLVLCGAHAPTICDGIGLESLAQAPRLKLKSVQKIKDELFIVYRVLEPHVIDRKR